MLEIILDQTAKIKATDRIEDEFKDLKISALSFVATNDDILERKKETIRNRYESIFQEELENLVQQLCCNII